jgi:hypothetical protein
MPLNTEPSHSPLVPQVAPVNALAPSLVPPSCLGITVGMPTRRKPVVAADVGVAVVVDVEREVALYVDAATPSA